MSSFDQPDVSDFVRFRLRITIRPIELAEQSNAHTVNLLVGLQDSWTILSLENGIELASKDRQNPDNLDLSTQVYTVTYQRWLLTLTLFGQFDWLVCKQSIDGLATGFHKSLFENQSYIRYL